jgi:hypothetical protein
MRALSPGTPSDRLLFHPKLTVDDYEDRTSHYQTEEVILVTQQQLFKLIFSKSLKHPLQI